MIVWAYTLSFSVNSRTVKMLALNYSQFLHFNCTVKTLITCSVGLHTTVALSKHHTHMWVTTSPQPPVHAQLILASLGWSKLMGASMREGGLRLDEPSVWSLTLSVSSSVRHALTTMMHYSLSRCPWLGHLTHCKPPVSVMLAVCSVVALWQIDSSTTCNKL